MNPRCASEGHRFPRCSCTSCETEPCRRCGADRDPVEVALSA